MLQNTFVNIYRHMARIGRNGEFSFVTRGMFHKLILNLHMVFITNISSVVFQSQKTIFLKTAQTYQVVFSLMFNRWRRTLGEGGRIIGEALAKPTRLQPEAQSENGVLEDGQ